MDANSFGAGSSAYPGWLAIFYHPGLALLGYAALAALAALLVRRARPGWGTIPVLLAANLPAPLLVLGAGLWMAAQVGPARPGETDAGGLAIAVYLMGGAFVAGAMLAAGVPAGWAALRWLGPRR